MVTLSSSTQKTTRHLLNRVIIDNVNNFKSIKQHILKFVKNFPYFTRCFSASTGQNNDWFIVSTSKQHLLVQHAKNISTLN